jgi:hypothetical protein
MAGHAGRLFAMNIGAAAVVCTFNTFPTFALSQFGSQGQQA